MGKRMRKRALVPELMLVSDARRTCDTASLIAAELGLSEACIRLEHDLYLASPTAMIEQIRRADPAVGLLAVVAHNPGITELVNRLAGFCIDNMPTASVAELDLGTDSWSEAGEQPARLIDFDYPKRRE